MMIQERKYIRSAACLASVIFLLTACGNDSPEKYMASAKQSLDKNEKKAAVIQIKNALQINPSLPDARYLLGVTLLGTGDPAAAEIELNKARSLKYSDDLVVPQLAKALLAQGKFKKITEDFSKTELGTGAGNIDLQLALSSAYSEQGMDGPAKVALDKALLADPSNVEALLMDVRRQFMKRDFAAANTSINSLLEKEPKNPDALKLKGDILLLSSNDLNAALEHYRKSVEVKSDYMPGHVGMMVLLLQQNKLDEATKELELVKKIAPNNPQTKYFETQTAYQKKDYKLARDLAQQLLKLAPNNPRGLQLAGAIEFQLNSYLQAEVYLNKALTASPNSPLARRMLTATYLRTGQPAKALTVLTPALNEDPVDTTLFSIAGEVYLQNGDIKKAGDYFAKASKLDPEDGRKRTSLALVHMMGSDAESAFGELRDISISDKGTSADMALVSAYLRRREFDKALKAIDNLEKKQPENPLSQNLRGKIQLALNDPISARKSFEASLVLNPTYFPAVTSLAALDVVQNKPLDASKRFEAILSKDPKNVQALLALADLRVMAGASKEEVAELIGKAISQNPLEISPRILLVNYYLRNKDYKLALSSAQNALVALPDSADVLEVLGRAQQLSGDINQAISTFTKLSSLQPLSPQSFMRLGEAYTQANNKDAATQNFSKALELKPDLLEAQRNLIALDIGFERYESAISKAKLVQNQRPKDAIGFMFEGDIYKEQKKWDEAIAVYRLGLKQRAFTELAVKLHTALLASGKKAEADKFSTTWMGDHSKDVGFLFYLADSALVKKDFLTAEKLYLAVMQAQPENAIAYNNSAWVAGQLKKDSAIGYAEKANTLAPNQPTFMDTMAMLLADKGSFVKAIELENKALVLQPDNFSIKFNLAKIYLKSGDKKQAKFLLEDIRKNGGKSFSSTELDAILKDL